MSQGTPAIGHQTIHCNIEKLVLVLSSSGAIYLCVVCDVVSANGSQQIQLPSTIRTSHSSPEVPGELNRKRTRSALSTVDLYRLVG